MATEGYLHTTVKIGERLREMFYGNGEELEAEAYRFGVCAVAASTDTPVVMTTVWHPHENRADDEACDCSSKSDQTEVWMNATARSISTSVLGFATS